MGMYRVLKSFFRVRDPWTRKVRVACSVCQSIHGHVDSGIVAQFVTMNTPAKNADILRIESILARQGYIPRYRYFGGYHKKVWAK